MIGLLSRHFKMLSFLEAFGAYLHAPARRQRGPLQVGVFANPVYRVVVGAQELALAAHTR